MSAARPWFPSAAASRCCIPKSAQLAAEILVRGQHDIQLCTNGMFMVKKLKEFKPHPAWSSTSTWTAWRRITTSPSSARAFSAKPSRASRPPRQAGFKVCTNTTVYKETDMNEIWELFEYLEQFKVDGHTISPAYGYSAVNDREIFMTRDDVHEKFKDIDKLAKRFPLVQHADLHGIPARASAIVPARPGASHL